MSVNPNQIVGTFFRAGTRLIGIIHTPTFQGRMVFGPDGSEEDRLIASINGWSVGFAEPVSAEVENHRFAVSLHPGILPQTKRLELASKGGVWFLTLS